MAGTITPVGKREAKKRVAWLAWALFALVTAISVATLVADLAKQGGPASLLLRVDKTILTLLPAAFAALAALILSRLPRNVIGWLLMSFALMVAVASPVGSYLETFPAAPAAPTPLLLLAAWFDGLIWVPIICSILLLPLLFPTGRPPSPRWRWGIVLLAVLFFIYLFLFSFSATIDPASAEWRLANPLGFIPDERSDLLFLPWLVALLCSVALCLAALFVRYRRAGVVEREQIKWLLFAFALFAVVYVLGFNSRLQWNEAPGALWNLLWALSLLTIPAAIAIAVLRYRLYAIDLIIRRTLIYGALTLLLALVYFGSIVLLQRLFTTVTGQQSPLAVVVSTLLIAFLFAPLRRKVKAVIDRRFYRSQYDAAQTLAAFAATCRDEVDLEALTAELLRVVGETMQPAQLSLWLRQTKRGS